MIGEGYGTELRPARRMKTVIVGRCMYGSLRDFIVRGEDKVDYGYFYERGSMVPMPSRMVFENIGFYGTKHGLWVTFLHACYLRNVEGIGKFHSDGDFVILNDCSGRRTIVGGCLVEIRGGVYNDIQVDGGELITSKGLWRAEMPKYFFWDIIGHTRKVVDDSSYYVVGGSEKIPFLTIRRGFLHSPMVVTNADIRVTSPNARLVLLSVPRPISPYQMIMRNCKITVESGSLTYGTMDNRGRTLLENCMINDRWIERSVV